MKSKNNKKFRNEWKYISHNVDIKPIQQKISALLSIDKNANSLGEYQIHSLYFDDINDTCAKKNVAGDGIRYKYRIRYYNTNSEKLKLEKKIKYNSFCHKKSVFITKEEFELLLHGDVEELLWSDKPLLKEFAINIVTKGFMPKVIVSYKRVAYVDSIMNIRITFDSNICASREFNKFLMGDFYTYPLMDNNYQVLEVKFDDILPSYIKNVIQSKQLNQQSFSKYYLSRKLIRNIYKL